MATLSDYSSPDEIRSIVGVSDEELENTTLALPIYVRNLEMEVDEIDEGIRPAYLAVWAKTSLSRTTTEQKFFDVVQLYSAFSVARTLLTSLPLFAPKRITDGRAEVERQADPFADTKLGVTEGYFLARRRLITVYGTLTGTSTVTTITPGLTSSVGLSIDPVTNA